MSKVKFRTSDGEVVEVDKEVAFRSQTVRNMIKAHDPSNNTPIPLPDVSREILAKVIEYCKYHVDAAKKVDDKAAKPDVVDDKAAKSDEAAKKLDDKAAKPDEAAKKLDDKAAKPDEEIKKWDDAFVKVDQATLSQLVLAAKYLNIQPLLDLTCPIFANTIIGKTPKEILETFNIPDDITPEVDLAIQQEYPWAFS